MDDKKTILMEIKELWKDPNLTEFDISEEILEYLNLNDLIELKAKILNSLSTLSEEQKEWLSKFRMDNWEILLPRSIHQEIWNELKPPLLPITYYLLLITYYLF